MGTKPTEPILVVGAGIAGLTAAYALYRQGFDVEVYESADKPIAEENIGIRLWSNATTALKVLGLLDQVRQVGTAINLVQFWSSNGLLLSENSIEDLATEIGTPSLGLRHADLMKVLVYACRDIPIHFGLRCVGYVANGDRVALRLEGGQEVPGSLVIGADGVRSAIREQLVGDGLPTYSGRTLWRGISTASCGLGKGVMRIAWGANNLHVGCWHVNDIDVAWFVRVDAPLAERDMSGVLKPRLFELIKRLDGPVEQLLDVTPEENISRSDVFTHTHTAFVRLAPVVLIGDAAHAMLNALGQSVGQAVEDGVVLARSLAAAESTMAGLVQFEETRKPRVRRVREQILRFDTIADADRPVLLWLRNKASKVMAHDSSTALWRELVTFPE